MNYPDDTPQDRIQRILNAYKREELSRKYGVPFDAGSNSNLSPEIEGAWLDYLAEFERQFEEATCIPLREFLGFPSPRPLANIPPSELEAELEHWLDRLAEQDVFIHFLHDIALSEAYRFVTEELMDETVSDMRIPGLRHHFIYEEFHPEADEDFEIDNI